MVKLTRLSVTEMGRLMKADPELIDALGEMYKQRRYTIRKQGKRYVLCEYVLGALVGDSHVGEVLYSADTFDELIPFVKLVTK